MLLELIRSFILQDHDDRELCIADDSRSGKVESAVRASGALNIKYAHNVTNLGYAKNLEQAIGMASGDVVIVLGDDDLLARPDSLSRYAAAFGSVPAAVFGYANLIQIDRESRATLLYPFFKQFLVAMQGREALEQLMLKSVLITGMSFRASLLPKPLFPSDNGSSGFPQVELVGRLLLEGPGLGIPEFLCASRAHEEQLGFKWLRGQSKKGGELPGVVEVLGFLDHLVSERPDITSSTVRIEQLLVRGFTTNLPNESLSGSKKEALRTSLFLWKRFRGRREIILLFLVLLVSLCLPARILKRAKEWLRARVLARQCVRYGIDAERPLSVFSDETIPRG